MAKHSNISPPALPDSRAIVLLARSAFSMTSFTEMEELAALVRGLVENTIVRHAFSEQGTPTLREVLFDLRRSSAKDVLIVPLIIPMEQSASNWLTNSLHRWTTVEPETWPAIRVAKPLGAASGLPAVLTEVLADGFSSEPFVLPEKPAPEASMIPPQRRRVLVCQGPTCNGAGALGLWNHLRNEQRRLKLRINGDGGTMTALSSCLGPCNLAPVLQVFPEGTYYCGIDEAGIDRIVADHLIEGKIVNELAYRPTGRKQKLRK